MPDGKFKTWIESWYVPAVWTLRLLVGALFIFSGFAKAVDPWGFIYKIDEYLDVWGIGWMSRESVIVCAVGLSAAEFTSGVLLLTGCLRRAVCWFMLLVMAFMLPLTFYIMVYDPVADCGCFGDALVISNKATFWKNVLITLSLVFLLRYNHRVAMIFQPMVQWLVLVASVLLCIILGIVGYAVQPLVDFRHYPVGGTLVDDKTADVGLIYERDGEKREFDIDNIPDSTWTYVGRTAPSQSHSSSFAIYDGDEEVTSEVLEPSGPQLLLMVGNPGLHTKARSGMANALNAYIRNLGGSMVGIVAASGDELEKWTVKAKPDYEVYTADDTTIKEIVRGNAGLVYLRDGRIIWKRNLYSLSADFPDFSAPGNLLDSVRAVDKGTDIRRLLFFYCVALFVIYLMGLVKLRKETARDAGQRSQQKKMPEEHGDNKPKN